MDEKTPFTVWPWLFFGVKIAGIMFCIFVGVLYYHQESLLYYPNPPGFPVTPDQNPLGFSSPDEYTKDGKFVSRKNRSVPSSDKIPFEEHMVETADGEKLHTWLLLQDDNESKHYPTLIYFHGNAGNMGFRLKNAVEMYSRVKMNILMMDYRGYGKSSGKPTEKGLKEDGDAVLKYVSSHPKLQGSPVIVFGRSLGGAVCFYLANKYPKLVHGVIVENTFLSISAMVDKLMPFLTPLKSLVLTIDWGSDAVIGNVAQPIFFISGDSDTLVPPFHMKGLYELATKSSHREFYSVSGGTHNDTWEVGGLQYYNRMKYFVETFIRKLHLETPEEKERTQHQSEEELSKINETNYPQPHSMAEEIREMITPDTVSVNPLPQPEDKPPGLRATSAENGGEESDYEMVDGEVTPSGAIPTMNDRFQVK